MADSCGAVCQSPGHSDFCIPAFPGCVVWLQGNPVSAPEGQNT